VKKVKVSLRPGSPGKKFYLFPSAEALYVWSCAMERGETITVPDIEELVLEPGGYIEAELRGFEYIYDDNIKFRRFDLIRLGKAQVTKNSSGTLVTIHTGWVSGGLLPMKYYTDADIDARILQSNDAKLDLAVLFKDDLPADEEDVDMVDEDPPPDDDGDE
jgi:hypothetical protein